MTVALSQVTDRSAGGRLSCIRPELHAYRIAWTSAADGSASEAIPSVQGVIRRVVFVPGSGGSQPSANYDVTLADADGVDVLAGQGANLSNSAASHVVPGVPLKDGTTTSVVPVAVSGDLTLAVANAGNAKSGTVVLYVEP